MRVIRNDPVTQQSCFLPSLCDVTNGFLNVVSIFSLKLFTPSGIENAAILQKPIASKPEQNSAR